MRLILRLWLIAIVFVGCSPLGGMRGAAMVLTLDGPLTSGFTVYFERNLAQAAREGAPLVILQVNTPGGSIGLMDKITTAMRNSPMPVVVFVTPRGAQAGSAGAIIAMAAHVAAMSPETVIGASSPVGSQGEDIGQTLDAKIKEDLKAKVRVWVERRGPAAVDLAEAMIDIAQAATVDEAKDAGLIDLIADDVPSLLKQLDGFQVTVQDQPRALATTGLVVTEHPLNVLETVLNLLTNPNVVYTLLSLGSILIVTEVSTPGGWVAGTLGVVCLALAFFGLGVLPVNWFGLIFIGLALVLFVLDLGAPSHGALTLAAIVSLVVGGLVLFNSPGAPEFAQVNVPVVIGVAVVLGGAFFALMLYGLRALHQPAFLGPDHLVGQTGEARSPNAVQIGSELWTAESDAPLAPGDHVVVTAVKGLRVVVKKQ
jgi:membrane-bound serine protease (ClpP class)